MGTTDLHGWPTPEDTDPAKDGAAAMRALADAADASLGAAAMLHRETFDTSSATVDSSTPVVVYDPFTVDLPAGRIVEVQLSGLVESIGAGSTWREIAVQLVDDPDGVGTLVADSRTIVEEPGTGNIIRGNIAARSYIDTGAGGEQDYRVRIVLPSGSGDCRILADQDPGRLFHVTFRDVGPASS